MTQQIQLFYEDIYDALRAAVQAAGGAKVVAHKLWPTVPVAQAHRDLLDALNRERARKLDPDEAFRLFRLAREAGFHAAFHFGCELAGYTKAAPLDPGDELAELQRQYIASVVEQRLIADRMERLSRAPLAAVK